MPGSRKLRLPESQNRHAGAARHGAAAGQRIGCDGTKPMPAAWRIARALLADAPEAVSTNEGQQSPPRPSC